MFMQFICTPSFFERRINGHIGITLKLQADVTYVLCENAETFSVTDLMSLSLMVNNSSSNKLIGKKKVQVVRVDDNNKPAETANTTDATLKKEGSEENPMVISADEDDSNSEDDEDDDDESTEDRDNGESDEYSCMGSSQSSVTSGSLVSYSVKHGITDPCYTEAIQGTSGLVSGLYAQQALVKSLAVHESQTTASALLPLHSQSVDDSNGSEDCVPHRNVSTYDKTHIQSAESVFTTGAIVKREASEHHSVDGGTLGMKLRVIHSEGPDETNYLKSSLKNKIMQRRMQEGKEEIDLSKEEEERQKRVQDCKMTWDENLKYLRRRQLNNRSARKCRMKRKYQEEELEREVVELKQHQERLRKLLKVMADRKKKYEDVLSLHGLSPYKSSCRLAPQPGRKVETPSETAVKSSGNSPVKVGISASGVQLVIQQKTAYKDASDTVGKSAGANIKVEYEENPFGWSSCSYVPQPGIKRARPLGTTLSSGLLTSQDILRHILKFEPNFQQTMKGKHASGDAVAKSDSDHTECKRPKDYYKLDKYDVSKVSPVKQQQRVSESGCKAFMRSDSSLREDIANVVARKTFECESIYTAGNDVIRKYYMRDRTSDKTAPANENMLLRNILVACDDGDGKDASSLTESCCEDDMGEKDAGSEAPEAEGVSDPSKQAGEMEIEAVESDRTFISRIT